MKFSIITPVYNGEKYIAKTIESVLYQEGDFEIEYIIQDGGSTDNTLEIVRSYANKLKLGTLLHKCKKVTMQLFSEKDRGMYDAINRGFSHATGDVYAYINADDIYLPNAFTVVERTFEKYPEILWLKGVTLYDYEDHRITQKVPMCYIYNQEWIAKGIYGRNAYFIHQDSVFWKRQLWSEVGRIPEDLRYAGDYYLWIQLAQKTPLWSVNFPVSCFRIREGQLSANMETYREEQKKISGEKSPAPLIIKVFFTLRNILSQRWMTPFFKIIYSNIFPKRTKKYISIEGLTPKITDARYYEIPIENL